MLDIIMYYISHDQETSQINIQIPILFLIVLRYLEKLWDRSQGKGQYNILHVFVDNHYITSDNEKKIKQSILALKNWYMTIAFVYSLYNRSSHPGKATDKPHWWHFMSQQVSELPKGGCGAFNRRLNSHSFNLWSDFALGTLTQTSEWACVTSTKWSLRNW